MTIYSVLDSQNHSSLTLSKGSIPFLCIPFLSVNTAQYHNMDIIMMIHCRSTTSRASCLERVKRKTLGG